MFHKDPLTQEVIIESMHLTSAKKRKTRILGFIKILNQIKSDQKIFEAKVRKQIDILESFFLEIDKEVKYYSVEIDKHNSILEPCEELLNEAVNELYFLRRYRYSGGVTPETISILELLENRIKILQEIMPMNIPVTQIVDEIKFKWHVQVMKQIKVICKLLFKDMNQLNQVVDFMKNDVTEIDLQKMVEPIIEPFIDFYGKRIVEEWGGSIKQLNDFENKIFVPFDTYTVVYFSVRESIVETVVNSVKPFINGLKGGM